MSVRYRLSTLVYVVVVRNYQSLLVTSLSSSIKLKNKLHSSVRP